MGGERETQDDRHNDNPINSKTRLYADARDNVREEEKEESSGGREREGENE